MEFKILKTIEDEKREMRNVFAAVMDEIAEEDDRVMYLDADLMNSLAMVPFAEKYRDRAINCGIQEANMIGTAAGLSAVGMIPYAHTFAAFASRRAMDQVFISGAYAKLNVKIIGSDPGITAAFNGGTHMPFEDLAVMRCIPGMTVIEPTDSVMLEDIIRKTKSLYGMYYIRLVRKKTKRIFDKGSSFDIGKGILLREGSDVTIIASGIMVAEALTAAERLRRCGISARVVNLFTIKPIDKEIIIESAKKTGRIVTAENHNIIGGLGSAVAEVLSESCPVPMKRIGVRDIFGEVGSIDYLKEKFALTAGHIESACIEIFKERKSLRE
ncbi:transketolase family protein [bacterium 210820-DFI.6.37]|nr:transketolase family protein [bacterium 210820-DFI.6.37]